VAADLAAVALEAAGVEAAEGWAGAAAGAADLAAVALEEAGKNAAFS